MNIFEYAMQMEQDGETFYRDLAAKTTMPGMDRTFTMLADDEVKHRKTLQALRDGGALVYGGRAVTLPPTTDPDIRTQLDEVVALWGEFREDVETLRTADPDSAAFVQAMREIEATSPVILQEMDEVVQLYVHDAQSGITRPVKELKGFKRITLRPGEQRTVAFTLAVTQLGFYGRDMKFVVEPGTIEVMVGSSSDDIRAEGEFEITGERTDISKIKTFFSEAVVR